MSGKRLFYKEDDYDILVKRDNYRWYTFSPYRGDTDWVPDPDKAGINIGKYLEYSIVTEDEARKILKKYHAEALIE